MESAFRTFALQLACLIEGVYGNAAKAGLIVYKHFPILYDSPERTLLMNLPNNEIIKLLEDRIFERVRLWLLLIEATREGNSYLVRYLLYTSTFHKPTLDHALGNAVEFCTCEDVDLLIQMGAKLIEEHLKRACSYNNAPVVQYIIDTYYTANTKMSITSFVTIEAFENTFLNKNLAQLFLERFDIPQFSFDELFARSVHNIELLEYLLENFTLNKGCISSAFKRASKWRCVNSLKLLIEYGPVISTETILDCVFYGQDIKYLSYLVEDCDTISSSDEIEDAVLQKKIAIAKALLRKGRLYPCITLSGITRERKDSSEAVDFLIRCIPFEQEEKDKALSMADSHGWSNVCKVLRQHGASL